MNIFNRLFRRKREKRARGYPPVRTRIINAGQGKLITSSWTTAALTPDQLIHQYLKTIRARSREQFENNDYARRFVGLLKSNVIGPNGVVLQSRTTRSNGTPDEPARRALEDAFSDWCMSPEVTGCLSFVEVQALMIQTVAVDGEFLCRKVRGRVNKWGFALQLIDAERLDPQYDRQLSRDTFIRASVEYNRFGRPVAYHILNDGDQYGYRYSGNSYTRIPASDIYHVFLCERVGQKRGMPWMATALERMWMLEGYQEAAVTAARIGAAKMGFFIPPDGDTMVGQEDPGGNLVSEVEPGIMEQLPPGTEFQSFDTQYPHQQFESFVKAMVRSIAASLGVSYHSLANDLEGVTFSSSRTGTIEEREMYKMLQHWVVRSFVSRVYNDWLDMALLSGIPIGNNGAVLNPMNVDRYRNVSWQGKRWPWVDPLKDVEANIRAVKSRFVSISSIIRESGRDPDDVFREIAEEHAKLKEMGIEPQDVMQAIVENKDGE